MRRGGVSKTPILRQAPGQAVFLFKVLCGNPAIGGWGETAADCLSQAGLRPAPRFARPARLREEL